MGEWKRGWKWIPRWLCREGEDSSSCRFSDEEIAIEGKHMNAGSIDVYSSWCSVKDWLHCCVLWSQPAERYHQPGMNSGQRKKGGDWWGKVRCLGVSQCHQLLVKEMKVKQMKWPTEWKLCAKLAPNKQTSVFFFFGININKATGGMTQIGTRSILMAELSWFFYAWSNASLWFQD